MLANERFKAWNERNEKKDAFLNLLSCLFILLLLYNFTSGYFEFKLTACQQLFPLIMMTYVTKILLRQARVNPNKDLCDRNVIIWVCYDITTASSVIADKKR